MHRKLPDVWDPVHNSTHTNPTRFDGHEDERSLVEVVFGVGETALPRRHSVPRAAQSRASTCRLRCGRPGVEVEEEFVIGLLVSDLESARHFKGVSLARSTSAGYRG